jgi:TPR repeat protein
VIRKLLAVCAVLLPGVALTADQWSAMSPGQVQKQCEAQDAEACAELAFRYREGRSGFPQAPAKSLAFAERSCTAGSQTGCGQLAILYEQGPGVEQDPGRAAELYARACNGKHLTSCARLGFLARTTSKLEAEGQRARDTLTQACEQEANARACYWLAVLARPESPDPPSPDGLYQALMRKACELSDGDACYSLGEDRRLSTFFQSGNEPEQGYRQAADLYTRACEYHNEMGCFRLGELYAEGRGVMKDARHAFALVRGACDQQVSAACLELVQMYVRGLGTPVDPAKAFALAKRSCLAVDASRCAGYAILLLSDERAAHSSTRAYALELLNLACDRGDADSCGAVADAYRRGDVVQINLPKAHALYERACKGGVRPACEYIRDADDQSAHWTEWDRRCVRGKEAALCDKLMSMYMGQYATPNARKVVIYGQRACDLGDADACGRLGAMLLDGALVRKDESRGMALLEKGCSGGSGEACDYVKLRGLRENARQE